MRANKRKFINITIFISKYRLALIFVLIGILLRLIFMPTAVHDDMLSSTYREYLWVFQGNFKVGDLMEIVMAGWMKLIHPALIHLPDILDRAHAIPAQNTVAYGTFVSGRNAPLYLFLLKIPYLFLDLGCLAIIWLIFSDSAQKIRGVALWALNPALIFAVFMWGRFETLPIFFVLLAFLLAQKKHAWGSVLALGIAIASRTGYILFLPFFLIYFANIAKLNWKEITKLVLVGIVPALTTSQIIAALGGGSLTDTLQRGFLDFTISGQISTGFTSIAINAMTFPLILYLFFNDCGQMTFKRLVNFSSIGLLSFFAFSYFHPQYLAWITPCLVLAFGFNKKIGWPFVVMILAFWFMTDLYFGFARTTGLFAPLLPSLFSTLGGLTNQSVFANWADSTLLTIFHSLFVLMIAWLSFILFQDANKAE